MVEQVKDNGSEAVIESQRRAMKAADLYANTVHETEDFIKYYNSIDPKDYDAMVTVIEFSDEQEKMAKVVY
jgi:hypothetical protein